MRFSSANRTVYFSLVEKEGRYIGLGLFGSLTTPHLRVAVGVSFSWKKGQRRRRRFLAGRKMLQPLVAGRHPMHPRGAPHCASVVLCVCAGGFHTGNTVGEERPTQRFFSPLVLGCSSRTFLLAQPRKGPPSSWLFCYTQPVSSFRMKCCRWNSTLPDADDFLSSRHFSLESSFFVAFSCVSSRRRSPASAPQLTCINIIREMDALATEPVPKMPHSRAAVGAPTIRCGPLCWLIRIGDLDGKINIIH